MSIAYAERAVDASAWTRELLETGYCIIPNLMPRSKVEAFHGDLRERFEKTPFSDGDF